MIATKSYINYLRENCRMRIDKALESYILSVYEEEPFPYEWSEQDLYEQIRKLSRAYDKGELTIPAIPSKYARLLKRYNDLQNEIVDLAILYYSQCGKLPGQFDYLNPIAAANAGGLEVWHER